jgi:uroporphyrin-III C-methyltransferase/precorrin-2 dehydrogenase/sirohydrochlorin ferrochelatase
VRLKGGDPFVLGRGGEEVLACAEAGIPVEVVPGITSAIAVPAAAGIPITHRGVASQFCVVSAHDDVDAVLDGLPDAGTLVILMGVGRLDALTQGLLAQGRPEDTPVAVIERGTLPEQRVTRATLATIAARSREVGVESPAVIVLGDVAGLAESLAPALGTITG